MTTTTPTSPPRRGASSSGEGGRGRVRVLHVITHLDHGGAQDNTLLSVEGMDRSRYEVDLAAGPGAQEQRARAVSDALHVLPEWRRGLGDGGDGAVLRRLLRLVGDYDVVHTHGSKAGVLGRLSARARGVPAVVHTVHGFPVTPDTPRAARPALLAAERLAARCCDAVLCVCEANLHEALELRIASPSQLAVVVSGVPAPVPRPGAAARLRAELGVPPDAPVVGSITRLMPQKAPLDLVAAARRLLGAHPDAHVVVVGDGPLREEVEQASAGLPRLHLLGHRSDVADLLDLLDVVVFSSRWEGLGRALTEAVLAGRPVVATAVNGVPDLVRPGVTGALVPPGRPDLLADEVLALLALPDRGRALGAAGRALADGRFGVDQMVRGLDDTYRSLLARARPRRREPR